MKDREDGSALKTMRRLEELEAMVTEAKGSFGTRVINEEAFYVLITQLRQALPSCLAEGERVRRRVEDILAEAHRKAEDIRFESQVAAERRLADAAAEIDRLTAVGQASAGDVETAGSLLAMARDEASRILSEATQEAERRAAVHPLVVKAAADCETYCFVAQHDSATLRAQSDEFAEAVLSKSGELLEKLLNAVGEAKVQAHEFWNENEPPLS